MVEDTNHITLRSAAIGPGGRVTNFRVASLRTGTMNVHEYVAACRVGHPTEGFSEGEVRSIPTVEEIRVRGAAQ